MPITAKFIADFDDFYAAVQKADVELRSFETSAAKVGTSLDRMADQFSGRKVIQDATLMVAAVEKLGGVTKLTTAEFQRLQATVTAASQKLQALGQAVPTQFQAITTSATGAAGAVGKVATQVGNVDRLAALAGVRGIGPLAGALGELSLMLGTSTGALLTFGSALAAFAVGKQAYTLTRSLLDMTIGLETLDTAVANSAAKLLGWGDRGAQVAAYQADRLAQASRIAGVEITSLTEAERINTQAAAVMAEADRTAAEKKKQLAAETAASNARLRAEFGKEFIENIKQREAAAKAAAKKAADEELAAKKAADAEKARAETAWRDYQNFLGERYMEDEAARLTQEAELHKQAVDEFIAEEARKYTAYLAIVGGAGKETGVGTFTGPKLPTGPKLGGRGSTSFTAPEISPYLPASTVTQTINIQGFSEEIVGKVVDTLSRTMREARRWPTA